ncbi:MAG: penicillin amidase, partial [Phenylobacterium sp.]
LYPLFLNEVVNGELQHWCDISDTQQVESCEVRALSALDNALDDLTLIGGSDIDDWQWGELHQTYYPHSAFSSIKLLNSWFNRSIASGGDGYTVNVAQTYFSRDNGFRQVTGASYRQVIDLSDFNHSGFINNTGQSGNVFSDNYDDFIDSHKQLQLLPMRFGDDNLQGQTLLLSPTISN